MVESTLVKKNKFSLSDYNYQKDIENRLLMARFSPLDFTVLEEILFSPLKTPLRKIAKNLSLNDTEVFPVLEKLSKMGLLSIEDDSVVIDKTMRKYFETEMEKFESDFKPGMDFLQNLLKKVPIHILPIWYALPRTSNNIFESIVEKYLLTPQIFQRYLLELNLGDPVVTAIAQDVFRSPQLAIPASALLEKYQISEEQLEESLLLLEFHFVCCVSYRKTEDRLEKMITPFHEWREYLSLLKTTVTASLPDPSKVKRVRPHDFSFVEDMSTLLHQAKKQPISLSTENLTENASYNEQLIRKLQLLKLAERACDHLKATEAATEWLDMRIENRALYLYRHPLNKITTVGLPSQLLTEKMIRDAEKSVIRVLHTGWVLFEDFVPGVIVSLGEHPSVTLKESGKQWKYLLPSYTPEELNLLHAVVFEGLFEAGITTIGTYEGKECFAVTAFGQSLFG